MGMEKNTYSCAFGKCLKPSRNGFLLMEAALSVLLVSMLFLSLVPAAALAVRHFEACRVRTELALQGILLDQTLSTSLRYADTVTLSNHSQLIILSEQRKSGFSVRGEVVYKILSNGNEQPLTGSRVGAAVERQIVAKPLAADGRGCYFEGPFIVVSICLQSKDGLYRWPCYMKVRPLGRIDEKNT